MLRDKITEIYVTFDDFHKEFEKEIEKHLIESSSEKNETEKASCQTLKLPV